MLSLLFTTLLMMNTWDTGLELTRIGPPIHNYLSMENLLADWTWLKNLLKMESLPSFFQRVQRPNNRKRNTACWQVKMTQLLLLIALLSKARKPRLFWTVKNKNTKNRFHHLTITLPTKIRKVFLIKH